MTSIVFSHANGFPAQAYSKLFEELAPYQISYVHQFADGDYPITQNWTESVKELHKHITENYDHPVVGIGHSFGGVVTLLLASEHPELFESLIILDPPLFSLRKRMLIYFFQRLNIWSRVFPYSRNALKRKNDFKSKEEAYEYFKDKKLFSKFDQQSFDSYIEHGLRNEEGELKLSISPEVESSIFAKMPTLFINASHNLKGTLFYAQKGSVLQEVDRKWHQKNFPQMKQVKFKGTHMFPLENPTQLAADIKQILKSSS